jgi:type IV pilus modification protein PilV
MNVRTWNTKFASRATGFSLIDVLVAVVVLSVGLLALAALQGSLVRAGSAARAQSQAMNLAQEKLEQLRGFVTTGGATGTYDSIQAATETISNVGGNAAVNTYTRTTTVNRYQLVADSLGDGSGIPAFLSVSSCSSGTGCTPIGINEFKRVTVSVAYTNESGQSNTVQIGDVISVASPGDAIKTLASANSTHTTPQVWIDPRKFAPGIIPIALGSGQSAAASDPQPETFSTGHITTRFSVQNYNTTPNGNGLVLLNKQFDFALTSCTCNMGTTSTLSNPAYAPTYWNGIKYISPTAIPASQSGSGKKTGTDPVSNGNPNNSSQDPILCQACCRDHHDDSAAQQDINGNPLRFDPFRPSGEYPSGSDHSHYDTNASNQLLTAIVNTSGTAEYYETCRLVRVDGFNRVAMDAREENHLLLAPVSPVSISKQSVTCDPSGDTITSGTCYDHAVDSTTATSYASFVKDYVTAFYNAYVTASSGGNYPLVANSVSPGVGDQLVNSNGTPSTLATNYPSLVNAPTQTGLSMNIGDVQYLEGRGLFIDYITPETKAALACIGQTTNPDCTTFASQTVLQVLPFVAVNQTNLDSWTPNQPTIQLTDAPIPTGGTFDPFIIGYTFDRGSVTALKAGTDNATAQARMGNASLVDSLSVSPSYPFEAYNCIQSVSPFASQSPCSNDPPASGYVIDTSTAKGPRFQTDIQPYTVAGSSSTNVSFSLSTTDNSVSGNNKSNLGSPVSISVSAPTLNPSSLAGCTLGSGNKQPYTCYSTSTATTITLVFANYNTDVSCHGNGCPNPPAVNDYKICSITGLPNGNQVNVTTPFTVSNSGTDTEQTSITLTLNPNGGNTITTLLNSMSLSANFYLQSQTCP